MLRQCLAEVLYPQVPLILTDHFVYCPCLAVTHYSVDLVDGLCLGLLACWDSLGLALGRSSVLSGHIYNIFNEESTPG